MACNLNEMMYCLQSNYMNIHKERKRKRNVNKIHQISLENNLIVHKIKEMQDS
jgi:hypothetical protein